MVVDLSSRGQISFEYLIIVGLALLVIVPALFFFLTFTGGGEDAVLHSRVAELGTQMVRTAGDSYALGRHSWLTLDVNIPEDVESISVYSDGSEYEFAVRYLTSHGTSEAVFYSPTPLTHQAISSSSNLTLVQDRVGQVSFRFTSQGTNVTVCVVGAASLAGC